MLFDLDRGHWKGAWAHIRNQRNLPSHWRKHHGGLVPGTAELRVLPTIRNHCCPPRHLRVKCSPQRLEEDWEEGEHGGLRRSRSALGRFLFRFLGAWQVAVAERAAGCSCKHTDVRTAISETRGSLEDSGGCLVARAALELRRTRKSVARIPLWGNSGSGSGSCRTGGAATEKLRLGEQPKEIPEKGARKKTVRQRGGGASSLLPRFT
ncbi:hypothetical protein NDU88_002769 [Pleurodeles waltl]|uniref:Uncharacterized protein n=1 Tax=Pleurodeles waltl TaxID=8319 RepID=A0AAV7VDI5_PLEWA|nr:hypothetical protein NDU88_002769 [Pleurodeles waltl]